MPARRARIRPSRRAALFTARDRLLALLVVVAAVALVLAALVTIGRTASGDPAAETTRRGLTAALSAQASPVLSALRRQAVEAARSAPDGDLRSGVDGFRLAWVTDSRDRVISTTPAAGALMGLQRPPRRVAATGAVGPPQREPLLGGEVVVSSAPLSGGRSLSVAVAAELVSGLTAPPLSVGDATAAVLAPDGTMGAAKGRVPADPDLLAAARAARAQRTAEAFRFTGQGGSPRSGAVTQLGDGWVAVAEGPLPDIGPERRRRIALSAFASAGGVITLITVLLAAGIVRRNSRHAEAVQTAVLAVTGHELRTPLTSILTTAQTLNRRWKRLKDDQREELVATIGRAARVLDRLVERLLHAGRLATGERIEVNARPTAVGAVVQRLLDDLRPTAPLHELRLEAHAGTPEALADPRALAQVIGHLLDNAVKFSPDGGLVQVTLRSEGRRRPQVRIEVQDEGVGLPSDTSRLFRPFGQTADVDTRGAEEGGVGVGLSIVKDLVEAMSGSVHAERLPTGSRFVVRLPGATGQS